MKIAELKYNYHCLHNSDINQHLPTLKKYAEKCNHVTELGVRGIVSTWAFLAGKPKRLISADIVSPDDFKGGGTLSEVYTAAKEIGVEFEFILGDDLKIKLEETDLMFIDTLHTYEQLIQELTYLSPKVKKYIILHDTLTFGSIGETGGDGLLRAVAEFLKANKGWVILEQFYNNNGLTVLSKTS